MGLEARRPPSSAGPVGTPAPRTAKLFKSLATQHPIREPLSQLHPGLVERVHSVERSRVHRGDLEQHEKAAQRARVDSLDAQVAAFYVQSAHPESWLAFDEAIFEALWIDGRDIGDEAVLGDLAEETGLDGDEIRTAIRDDALRNRLHEEFLEAQRQGITGVPTFAYDRHAARGAVPPEHLARLVEEADS